jgi:GAF domain-containing protein
MPARNLDAEEIERALAAALGIAGQHDELGEVLAGIATLLGARYPVSRVSVRTHDPADDSVLTAAVWTGGAPTQIAPGIRLPAKATSYYEVDRRGGAILSGWKDEAGAPLLDRMIHEEGNESWVVIPLRKDERLAGLLTVAASAADAFEIPDLPFFEALGAALGERLLKLAARPPEA